MQLQHYLEIGTAIVAISSVAGVGILWNTVKVYKEDNEALRGRVSTLEAEHTENKDLIKELQGQVDIFRSIPLKEIAETQKDILHTQREILELVKTIKEV